MKKNKKRKRRKNKKRKLLSTKERLKKATDYEKIAKRIYKLLSPQATVVHNDKIFGDDSKKERQIDVSIRSKIAGHEILIVVNCKDQQRKATVNQVGELYSVMHDVKAHKGVLICNSGFTAGAKNIAKNRGIELCSIHDAESKDWRLILKFPIVYEKIRAKVGFEFEYPVDEPGKINIKNFQKFKENTLEEFHTAWFSGKIPFDKDKQVYELSNHLSRFTDSGSKVKCDIEISRTYYLGYVDQLPKAKALKNETTGNTELLISIDDFSQIEGLNFIGISSLDDAPVPVANHLRCLMIPRISFQENGKIQITGVRL